MNPQRMEGYKSLPKAGSSRPLDFEWAEVVTLSGITGTRGVEVIDATRSEKMDVPHEEPAGYCRDWSAWHDHERQGPPVQHIRGECEFPTACFSVEQG